MLRPKPEYVGRGYYNARRIEDTYREIEQVGAGAFGRVFKAYPLANPSEIVALKKIEVEDEQQGFPITALREIMVLKKLSHPNLVTLIEVVVSSKSLAEAKNAVYLVFEYMEHDLLGLIARKIKFTTPQIKFIMKQILQGLNHLHQNSIIHRDIKTANILLNKHGEVKVGDFGLCRVNNHKGKPLTIKVMTMIYRAPEILLGMPNYTSQVDLWSVGCVFAELLISEPLFCTAKTPHHLLDQMFCRMGNQDESNWPGITQLPFFEELNPKKAYEGNLASFMYKKNPKIDRAAMSLLTELLQPNPDKRVTAQTALQHEFFTTDPFPCSAEEMPRVEKECHELEIRKMIQAKKEKEREREAAMQGVNGLKKTVSGLGTPGFQPMQQPQGVMGSFGRGWQPGGGTGGMNF